MTTADQPAVDLREPAGWRRTKNQIATAAMWVAFVFAVVPLGFVLYTVIAKGASIISWQFLTGSPIPPNVLPAGVGGMGPAVIGTILITGLAAVMAVPLGILGAVYVNEYGGRGPLAQVVRFMADVMTGVPSIVMGLFIATVWVSSGLHFGYSSFAGSLALACLMLPIVIRSSEEMLKLVPSALRQASDALGARRWRTILSVVLPAALPGIVSGSMLAIARAAGETAPLLFTLGITRTSNWNPFHGTNTALSQEIWFNAQQPYNAAINRAWGMALTLIAIVFVCTIIARVVASRFSVARQ